MDTATIGFTTVFVVAVNIRSSLLIHDIQVKEYYDDNGQDGYTDYVDVKKVRVEPTNKLINNGVNAVTATSLIFVDVKNSIYPDINIFKVGSVIKFEDVEYIVYLVDKLYTTELHHLELYVC